VKTFGLYEEGFLAACTINGGGTGGGSGGGGGGGGSGVGTTWTLRNPGFGAFCSVTYGNGTFVAVGPGDNIVAVGEDGAILTSPDGVSWTARTSVTSNYLNGVTYGNGRFVAVGNFGTILTSP